MPFTQSRLEKNASKQDLWTQTAWREKCTLIQELWGKQGPAWCKLASEHLGKRSVSTFCKLPLTGQLLLAKHCSQYFIGMISINSLYQSQCSVEKSPCQTATSKLE